MVSNVMVKNGSAKKRAILEELWTRASRKGDLPALSQAVRGIVEAMRDDEADATSLTNTVLSDFSLTQNVLRLSNSAMYAAFGGNISTVSKAMLILGADAVGHLALSVRLLDTLGTAGAPGDARKELAKAMLAGSIARETVGKMQVRDGEEGVVCALLHHLGRLLAAYYFPQEWEAIQARMKNGSSEEEAALAVLGITLDELGQAAAVRWNLPGNISYAMGGQIDLDDGPLDHRQWLRALASFSSESASALAEGPEGEEKVNQIAARYAEAFMLSPEELGAAVRQASTNAASQSFLAEMAQVQEQRHPAGKPEDAQARLDAGLEEVAQAVSTAARFNDVVAMALETMFRSLGATHVLLVLLDASSRSFRVRAGLGEWAKDRMAQFRFAQDYAPDVFHAALAHGADIFIQDALDQKIAARVPAWHLQAAPGTASFVILPLTVKGRTVGFLYADWLAPVQLGAAEMATLKALRSHVAAAMARASNAPRAVEEEPA